MVLRLLRRELAAADELRDERVVVGQLLELAAADAVGARVADVADRDRRVVEASATVTVVPMPEPGRVLAGALVDAAVRLLDQRGDALLGRRRRRSRSRSALAARREATSPACAPPMPSATAKSGGSQT